MHGTDYSTISGPISLRLGMLVHLHAPYILLIFHANISYSSKVTTLFCDLTKGELAVQPAMHLRGEVAISQARPASMVR